MATPLVTANPPAENADPWFVARDTFDAQLKATANAAAQAVDAVAGLNVVGLGRAVFIANGGTVPVGTPPYTIVIEASA